MKVKLKDKNSSLPNCWKECGVGKDDWAKLNLGQEIEVMGVSEHVDAAGVKSVKNSRWLG